MKKKTKISETKQTLNYLIIIMAAIIIILGAIGIIAADEIKEFLICIVISGLGTIIYDFAQLFLYWKVDKRDRLD